MAAVGRDANDSREICRKSKAVATSEVEDDCSMRETALPTDEGDIKQIKVAAAVRGSSSQETAKMVDSRRASKGKKHKNRVASSESVGDEKKTIAERGGLYKHSKSTRNKHQTLLKLKLRKTVSKARLKSYGISI